MFRLFCVVNNSKRGVFQQDLFSSHITEQKENKRVLSQDRSKKHFNSTLTHLEPSQCSPNSAVAYSD
eukprot:scaffold1717_cov117-Cylindrotheca_fusiformis.AAC.9